MSDTKAGPAERTYDTLHHRQYVKTLYADAALAEKDARVAELKAELAVAIELVTMARQTFDANGNGTRFLSEIRDDVLKDVKRLAKRGKP